MAKAENLLPINAMYLSRLRDGGYKAYQNIEKHNKQGKFIGIKTQLDHIDFIIYIMLLSRADKTKLTCWPSIETICKDCMGLDRRTAWDHLQDLALMGFIQITKRVGQPNIYYMHDFAEWKKHQVQ